ncbi:MAG: DUF1549 domain-containing protein, partial [Pirellulaceae bacterium]
MSDDRDPILDAWLDELLAGHKPPDLSGRILRALEQDPFRNIDARKALRGEDRHPRNTEEVHAPAASTPVRPDVVLPRLLSSFSEPSGSLPHMTPAGGMPQHPNRRRAWRDWSIAGGTSLVLLIGLMVLIAMGDALFRGRAGPPLARDSSARPAAEPPPGPDTPRQDRQAEKPSVPPPPRLPAPDAHVSGHASLAAGVQAAPLKADVAAVSPVSANAADSHPVPSTPVSPATAGTPAPPDVVLRQVPALDDDLVIAGLDERVRKHWQRKGVEPSPQVTDAQWLARYCHVVLGRAPTAKESEEFERIKSDDRRAAWTATLIEGDRFTEDFARLWSDAFTAVFLDARDLTNVEPSHVEGLRQYFRRSLLDRRPWHETIAGLLTAHGSGVPGAANYDGATNFLLARWNKERTQVTSDVARLFLGRNLQCQQCHDDPRFGAGKQHEYWALNGFFRQTEVVASADAAKQLVDIPATRRADTPTGVFYSTPSGLVKVAKPAFLDGRASAQERDGVSRRQQLAEWILESPEFQRTLANRVWARIMGHPVYDLEQVVRNRAPVHPELLIFLSEQWAAHDFDLRRLVSWLVRCEPFQRASGERIPSPPAAPGTGEPELAALFDRYYESTGAADAPPRRALLAAQQQKDADPAAAA